MSRVVVVQGGEWNTSIVEQDLGVPALSVEPILSPMILVDGRVEPDASRWLAEVHARTDGTETASSYAESLAGWIQHLLRCNTSLRGATRKHVVAFVKARTVDINTRVAGTTWRRDRTAIKQFHTWLRETHNVAVPFTIDLVVTPRGPIESMREGRGVAAAAASATPLAPAQIPHLLAAAWRLDENGVVKSDSLIGARDAAFIALGLASGARLNTLANLTIWEVPHLAGQGDLIDMRLPGAVTKGRREARLPAFRTHLEHVWSYAHPASGSRRLLLKGWQPENPIRVSAVHNTSGGFWGITDDRGRRHAFNELTASQRRRLLTPEGEPAVLFLNAYTGEPLSRDSAQEITGDVSRIAEGNAEARDARFPHVHTHDLRHTYATHLAAVFVLGVPTDGQRDMHGRPHRVDISSAIQMVRVGLGHLNEGTTALYTQQVGIMLSQYTLDDFLGRV